MTDVTVEGGLTQENAILLLGAVDELGLDASVVRTSTVGFVAPKKVVDKAGLKGYDPDAEFNAEIDAARAEVEADNGPHDHAAPVAALAPTLNDEGILVPPNTGQADPVTDTVVTAPETIEAAQASGTPESEIVEQVEATGDPAAAPVGTPVETVEEPPRAGRGSGTEAWQNYAKSKGATDADIADLSRDDLVEKYGTKE